MASWAFHCVATVNRAKVSSNIRMRLVWRPVDSTPIRCVCARAEPSGFCPSLAPRNPCAACAELINCSAPSCFTFKSAIRADQLFRAAGCDPSAQTCCKR